jgi:hypothetical protein
MHILEDHQYRGMPCQCHDWRIEGFQRSLSALLGRKLKVDLSSFVCAVSLCVNPAARSIWLMIG